MTSRSPRAALLGVALTIPLFAPACGGSTGGTSGTTGSGGAASSSSSSTGGSSSGASTSSSTTSSSGGASSSSGGGTTSSSSSTSSGGASCTPGTNVATVINKDHDPGPAPTMTGGTIVDGAYVLTKMVQYNGENGNTPHKDMIFFSAGQGQALGAKDGVGADMAAFFTYATSGNMITLTLTCGASGVAHTTYTATATEFTMVNPDDANEVHTYAKQ